MRTHTTHTLSHFLLSHSCSPSRRHTRIKARINTHNDVVRLRAHALTLSSGSLCFFLTNTHTNLQLKTLYCTRCSLSLSHTHSLSQTLSLSLPRTQTCSSKCCTRCSLSILPSFSLTQTCSARRCRPCSVSLAPSHLPSHHLFPSLSHAHLQLKTLQTLLSFEGTHTNLELSALLNPKTKGRKRKGKGRQVSLLNTHVCVYVCLCVCARASVSVRVCVCVSDTNFKLIKSEFLRIGRERDTHAVDT